MFKPKLKSLAFLISVFVLTLVSGYFIFAAWTEPTGPAPTLNVDPPINVGTDPQAKAARISATEFYDYNDPDYFVNPSGWSALSGNLGIGIKIPTEKLDVQGGGVKIGNFRIKPTILGTELWIYDSVGNPILILD